MADENKIPVVTRTQVYLNDPEYFCNKSWTMSYNLNTKTWISFHTYIPNFYIGENNFFYSGLNGCCDDGSGIGFQAVAGVLDKGDITTTTSTTFYPSPTTSTTTTVLSCDLEGVVIITSCELEGNGIITAYPTTTSTTTVCRIPSGLQSLELIKGYTLGTGDNEVIFTNSFEEACNAMPAINYVNSAGNTDGSTINMLTIYSDINPSNVLEVGQLLYYGTGTSCIAIPDGYYVPLIPVQSTIVYYIVSNVVASLQYCECGTTTSTTTSIPNVPACCGVLGSSNDTISYIDKISNITVPLYVPGYASSLAIAMTSNRFWSIDTDIKQWDIILSPFSALSSGTINLPVGFVSGYGLIAKNNSILIAVDASASPQNIVELDITGATAVATTIFSLETDRESIGNMLYSTDGKLIIINQDSITSDYYISQYNYSTGVKELDLNIGSIQATSLYECECDTYVVDVFGNLYVIIKIEPFILLNLGNNINLSPVDNATQVASCVTTSIIEINTTTTTTTLP